MALHQPMDLLIHVVRAFDDENITHVRMFIISFLGCYKNTHVYVDIWQQSEESIDPARDIRIVNDELIEKVPV